MERKIKVVIFGATGMVGRGVLLECLDDPRVELAVAVNRTPLDINHEKYREILHNDFLNFSEIELQLMGFDACYFCMGISAIGLSEEKYTLITLDYTLSAANALKKNNPEMVFCYVSGTGTDSTEKGSSMWARVKGRTENDILKLNYKDAYMFRPGYIQPMRGIKSKTGWYNAMYVVFKPLYPFMKTIAPNSVTTTVNVGKAMINVVLIGDEKKILESKDINRISKAVG